MTSEGLLAVLASKARGLAHDGRRAVLGITGAPGSGKTTFADALAEQLRVDGWDGLVARVPMDGFHLADEELRRLGRLGRKGAPDTFDVGGYVSLLGRLRGHHDDGVVYAPAFDRRFDQPIAGSIVIQPSVRLVITEGNYLLFDGEWAHVGEFLDQTWYVEVDEDVRLRRLVARHMEFGKPAGAARDWARDIDQRNADLVGSCRHLADLVVHPDRGQIVRPDR